MVITDIVEKNALEFPERTAVIERYYDKKTGALINTAVIKNYSRRLMTYKAMENESNKIANYLLSLNIKKGDKFAIVMANCLEWFPIYYGILKTGAVVVPIDFRSSSDNLKYCMELAQCKGVFFSKESENQMSLISGHFKDFHFIFIGDNKPDYANGLFENIKDVSAISPKIPLSEDDYAGIYFSSGTTGFPKAILHKHSALMATAGTEIDNHGETEDDVLLSMPPLYHMGAIVNCFGCLMAGCTVVLLNTIAHKYLFETISDEKVTIAGFLLPWMYDILDAISLGDIKLKDYDLSKWRLTHSGAQPIPIEAIERWMKQFPTHSFDIDYGLTEAAGPGCTHLYFENIEAVKSREFKGYCVGKKGNGWEVKILNDNHVNMPDGQIGELAVKGSGVMAEYYRNEGATSMTLIDGYLLTGDMAYKDKDGYVYIAGRKKDMIISAGENIYPVQIEDYLRRDEGIKDVAVIGMPNERLGEIVVAIVELMPRSMYKKRDIINLCRDLPEYMRPQKVIFETIPRNATGKVDKKTLKSKYIQ